MTLRATHALGANAVPVLERAVDGLRHAGVDIAVDLTVAPAEAHLLLACGLLTIEMIDRTGVREIIAAPRFEGETAAVYRSVVVTRTPMGLAEAAESTLAVNEYGSWSGWHGLVAWLGKNGLAPAGRQVVTGSHVASAAAVRTGEADVAAIDATIWRELVDHDGLTVIATTDDWPAPPVSIATSLSVAEADRITDVVVALDGFEPASATDYRFMLAHR